MEKEQDETTKDDKPKSEKLDVKKTKKVVKKKKSQGWWVWPLKILVLTLALSFLFSIASESLLSKTGIIVSTLIIVFLLVLAVISDVIGVAAASCSIEPFTAMSSRKVRGAKEAIFLVKNAEKVSSISNDVIGDICGIVSGAAGATIISKILVSSSSASFDVLIAAGMSALIAGLTVFGKALGKKFALTNSTKVIMLVGKALSIFTRTAKKSDKSDKNVNKDKIEKSDKTHSDKNLQTEVKDKQSEKDILKQ